MCRHQDHLPFASLRTSSHDLAIERGRYHNTPRENRICAVCHSGIETEYHFTLVCSCYRDLRVKYISDKYWRDPNLHKFNILLSTQAQSVLTNLASYVYYAFERRSELVIPNVTPWTKLQRKQSKMSEVSAGMSLSSARGLMTTVSCQMLLAHTLGIWSLLNKPRNEHKSVNNTSEHATKI